MQREVLKEKLLHSVRTSDWGDGSPFSTITARSVQLRQRWIGLGTKASDCLDICWRELQMAVQTLPIELERIRKNRTGFPNTGVQIL